MVVFKETANISVVLQNLICARTPPPAFLFPYLTMSKTSLAAMPTSATTKPVVVGGGYVSKPPNRVNQLSSFSTTSFPRPETEDNKILPGYLCGIACQGFVRIGRSLS
jgi:hypothetical protein